MLAALDGVGFDADQTEQAGDGGVDMLGEQFGVVEHGGFGGGEGLEHRYGDARVAARRVDADFGGVAQPLDARAVLAPIGQPFGPLLGLGGGQLLDRQVLLAGGFLRLDPGEEVLGPQQREGQHEVRQVAFGVDEDGGDAVDGGFFDQR